MKNIIFTMILCAGASIAAAQTPADTVLDCSGADRMILVETPDEVILTMHSSAGEGQHLTEKHVFNIPENASIKSMFRGGLTIAAGGRNSAPGADRWMVVSKGISFGFISTPGCDVGTEASKSFEIGWNSLAAVGYSFYRRHNFVSLGIGLNWRNYKMTGDTRWLMNDGSIATGPYEEGLRPRNSRLKTFAVTFPLTYSYTLKDCYSFSLSAILNVNTYGSLLTNSIDGEGVSIQDYRRVSDKLHKVSVDFMASVSFIPMTSLYIRYSPVPVLQGGAGPRITPLSAGIGFFF